MLIAAMVLTACSPDDDDDRHSVRRYPDCAANTTCGTCTPVVGCGWCSFGDGTGQCASGPSACGSTFRWNWEPADCPGGVADTGVTPEAAVEDTGTETAVETGSETATTCSAPDAVGTNCARTTGGSLCGDTQYAVGCHTTAARPNSDLGCTLKTASGTSTYYCCPCR